MNDFSKYHENIKKMKQNLDFVSELNKDIFKKLEKSEDKKTFSEIMADTDRAIELMKKGDLSELNKLQNKYADKNS